MRPTPPSDRTRVRRLPDRGAYDRETIHAILDEGLVCHVGFAVDAQPYVIPTISVLRLPLAEASAKIRTGPPLDDAEDLGLGCWAGVVPLRLEAQPPVPDPQLAPEIGVPEPIARYRR